MVAGKRVFVRTWLPAGIGPKERHGLGPLYNAASCADCHFKDGRGGRGGTPAPRSFLLSNNGSPPTARGADAGAAWGRQLQHQAVAGEPEGRVEIAYETIEGRYADGTTYRLRRPHYTLADVEANAAPKLGPRIAPTLVGIGLLGAVPSEVILAWADPSDSSANGISGRAGEIDGDNRSALGRFGWKASQADLAAQVAYALAEDLGVVSTAGTHEAPEITSEQFAALIDYLWLLAPPAQRTDHPLFDRGQRLFQAIGCSGCHRERLTTASDRRPGSDTPPDALLRRSITPYTDLLLHDLGPGLADGDGSTEIDREWRTAPLWGLGLMEVVNGQLRLLHDGRVRSFAEAILWHDGEARAARERFRTLDRHDRDALVAFLKSI